jgi:hypothetical protein
MTGSHGRPSPGDATTRGHDAQQRCDVEGVSHSATTSRPGNLTAVTLRILWATRTATDR